MPETVPLLNANISLNVDVIESYKPPDFNQISGVPGPGPCFSHNYCAIGWMWGCEVFSYALGTNGAQSLVSAHAIENAPIIDVLRRCDLAVASDVVYDPSGYEPLLASIIAFLRADTDPSPERMFIMAHRHRNPEDYRSGVRSWLTIPTTQTNTHIMLSEIKVFRCFARFSRGHCPRRSIHHQR